MLIASCANTNKKQIVFDNNNALEINISDSNFKQLEGYRGEALKNGVLDKSLKKYVEGTITYRGEKVPIKLRLKGDWVDHLKSNKWSFRIKVTGNNAFLGLKSFSIQSPHTRSFLHEWFMHQAYLQEDVLTTRYEFIPVVINGKQMGVYALEEHFDKQLVEAKGKREGPILKFNEEGVWETRIGDPDTWHALPYFEAAEVVPFKKNRTMNNPVLKKHFKTAQILMLRHKAFDENIDELFDLDRLSRFYALTDIANTDHALIWHNLRFYYNPVSRKLEPIAYDCYPEKVEMSVNQPIFGYSKNKTAFPDYSFIHYHLFNNADFKSLYIGYLKKYSDKEYLNKLFIELDSSLTLFGEMLAPEYPYSKFNKEFYYNSAKAIREVMQEYLDSDIKYELRDYPFEDFSNSNAYYYHTGLKAYSSPFQDSLTHKVRLYNFHSCPVTIIGYGIKRNKDSLIRIKTNFMLSPNKEACVSWLPETAKTIYFIADNRKLDTLKTSISKWAFNERLIASVKKPKKRSIPPQIEENAYTHLYTLKPGKHTFSSDIVIPKGWTFVIPKGSQINLINRAAIISYSPIHAEGEESEKILIHSSDGSGQGLVVIDKYGHSALQHVEFRNLSSLNKYGWFLTGAVTFYQANISIDNCSFENNHCEDAINLVKSSFTFSNSTILNTVSDGFDSDFSVGTISRSVFKNTGNDCIDLSGSVVQIIDCKIENSGDKGVSGGENSTITIEKTSVVGAKIAVASKDKTAITIKSITIEQADRDYVIFRKKPEYGPAKIIVKNSIKTVAEHNNIIGVGSLFIFKGDTIKGTEPIDRSSLYKEFK